MPTYNFNRLLLFCVAIFTCFSSASQPKPGTLFKIDPTKYDDGFTYFIFPFNDTFIKVNKVKIISYYIKDSANKHVNEFDKNGHLIKTYWIKRKEQSKKADTSYLEERIYNHVTGLLDTLITFDDRPLFTSVSCYQYDSKNRLDKILRFGLTEMNSLKEDKKVEEDFPYLPPPITESDIKLEPVNKLCLHGRPIYPATFNTMIRNNDFSSIQYKYYLKDQVEIEEQTAVYDFLKIYGQIDTCKKKTFYYSYGTEVVNKLVQHDCMGDSLLYNYYVYKNGLVDSIIEATSSKPRDVQLIYDSKNNLTGWSNIWDGKKVSNLEIMYDEKGLLRVLQRKSIWGMATYFMDNILIFETAFF